MNRVRGRILLWTALLAFVLGATMVNFGYSNGPVIYIDPSYQSVLDYDTSDPPMFTYNIMIDGATDVYAWGLRLTWDFNLLLLDIRDVDEGGFLYGPLGTGFAKSLNLADRYLDLGCTIIGDYPGVSGGGTLATVTFTVRDVGETPLHLFGAELLDSDLDPTFPEMVDGAFAGLTSSPFEANLVMKRLDDHYILYPSMGNSMWFYTKVKNTIGPYPLYVQSHIAIVHETGMAYTLKTTIVRLEPNTIADLNFEFMLATKFVGKWTAVCNCIYSYGGSNYIVSEKVKTFSFTIAEG